MNESTIIKSVLVVPYSKQVCLYYINEGDRHATTYEKVVSLVTDLAPELAIQVHEKMIRRISFYMDLVDKKIYEVESDKVLINNRSPYDELNTMKREEDLRPKHTGKLEDLIQRVLRRKE